MNKKLDLVAKTNKMKPSEVIMASTCIEGVRDFGDEIAEALDPMVKLFKKIGDGDSGDLTSLSTSSSRCAGSFRSCSIPGTVARSTSSSGSS